MVYADALDQVFYGVRVIGQGGLKAVSQEGRKCVRAYDAAVLRDEAQGVVRLVSRMVKETARVGVGAGDGRVGQLRRLKRRAVADVGEVNEHPQPIHLAHQILPEHAEAVVRPLVAAVADKVSLVVGYLNDADAQRVEEREAVKVVSDGRRVLPSENDARLAHLFGGENVGGGRRLRQGVRPRLETMNPSGDVVHRPLEPLPNGDGGVDSGDPPGVKAAIDLRAAPVADVQAVEHDGVGVYVGRGCHGAES